MGVFSKLKGIFYDEVDEEEDDTKEVEKVNKILKKEPKVSNEIPKIEEVKYKPVEVEEVKEDTVKIELPKEEVKEENDRELFRSERTFNFVDFSDDEEEEIVPSRRNVLNEQNRSVKLDTPVKENEPPKAFKPTPVISPIWGVLNKDYKKEEIEERQISNDNLSSAITSYDNVRRKAYGTLEDELEDTLNSMSDKKVTTTEIKKEITKVDKDVDLLEQKTQKIEDLISKIEDASNDLDKTMSLSIGELEEKMKDQEEEKEEAQSEVEKTITDSTLEHDLFNLIDSMYDDKEE